MYFRIATRLIAILLLLFGEGGQLVESQPHLGTEQTLDFVSYREANLLCNGVSKSKRTIIKQPSALTSDSCVYHIQAYSSNVCQLLIEFQRFELQQPIYNSATNTLECGDHVTIGDFSLCGDNTGQHLYLPFNVAKGVKEIPLTFSLPNRWPLSSWSLVVTQLECPVTKRRSEPFRPLLDAGIGFLNPRTFFSQSAPAYNDWEFLAPPGCNQYFTQTTGKLKSFNFKADGSAYYLPNMNYVICIKSVTGATIIEYQAEKFSMSNELESSAGYDSDCHSVVQTEGRREDYLMIPQSFVANSLNIQPTYYCGTSLQTRPTLLASAPFMLYFSSDGLTDATETGFSINYHIRTP